MWIYYLALHHNGWRSIFTPIKITNNGHHVKNENSITPRVPSRKSIPKTRSANPLNQWVWQSPCIFIVFDVKNINTYYSTSGYCIQKNKFVWLRTASLCVLCWFQFQEIVQIVDTKIEWKKEIQEDFGIENAINAQNRLKQVINLIEQKKFIVKNAI